jgi:hypothetical protein
MGNQTAISISETDITLEQQIAWHLQGNHYPPIPTTMVQPCIDAIDAYNQNNGNLEIEMPEGVFYKGNTTAPAWAIIDQHHLSAWCYDEDYIDDAWINEDEDSE